MKYTKNKKINGIIRIIHAAHLKKGRDIDADEKIYIINIYIKIRVTEK